MYKENSKVKYFVDDCILQFHHLRDLQKQKRFSFLYRNTVNKLMCKITFYEVASHTGPLVSSLSF